MISIPPEMNILCFVTEEEEEEEEEERPHAQIASTLFTLPINWKEKRASVYFLLLYNNWRGHAKWKIKSYPRQKKWAVHAMLAFFGND